jgi:two-component system, OmpR family, response regulator
MRAQGIFMKDVGPANKRTCKVLVVEDDSGIRELLSDVLESEGYHFILAGNAGEMRAALAEQSGIDIVIIDVRLPGGDSGIVLAQEISARGLPVILTSGDRAHFDAIGRSGHRHIAKPFRLAALLALIEETLAETRANCEREHRAAG